MNKMSKGLSFYVLIAVAAVLIYMILRSGFQSQENYTYEEFQEAAAAGDVSRVDIHQNAQTPTGQAYIYLKDGTTKIVNVPDVKEVRDDADQYEIPVHFYDVKGQSVLTTVVLPMAIMGIVVLLLFAMMNRQASGGNSKMMNFGKSRAVMTLPDSKKVTFKDVAGLQEEKEELTGDRRLLKGAKEIFTGGSQNSQGRASGRTSGNRQNPSGQGRSRGGRRAVLQHLRLRLRGDVRGSGRIQSPGSV